LLLAIDTSTLTLTLALTEWAGGRAGAVLESVEIGPPKKQSELLPGAIGELLARRGVALKDLSGIAVGLGPGSFTGLRIGLACAKALSYAAGLRLTGVSSLAATALQGPRDRLLLTSAVARQGDLYVGPYRRDGEGVVACGPEEALTVAELAARLKADPSAVCLGPSVPEYRVRLEEAGAPPSQLITDVPWPTAVSVARLARLPESYRAEDSFALEPHYVRASEPERDPRFPPLPGPPPQARIRED
jgi:tRNA threonylcarbamoyladenosine biosynthesis protein TsaB